MIEIKGIKIGDKKTKICVPLVGGELDRLLGEAKLAASPDIDFVEWRADCFNGILDPVKLHNTFSALKKALSKPMLFTVRTAGEGGQLRISHKDYSGLLHRVIRELKPDLIDIEISCGEKNCRELVALAKSNSVATVLSSHNFESTPTRNDMMAVLNRATGFGGDIAKLAVMPGTPSDVLELLSVSEKFSSLNPGTPVIAIAMGRLGKISRVSGGFFGSAVTFAALEQASAPGQIPFDGMRKILDLLDG